MNIILEGPDASGKTTLAKFLCSYLRLPYRHSGGPSKYPGEIVKRADAYMADPTAYIYDRHPCISQNIYAAALKKGELIPKDLIDRFYSMPNLLVYCRPLTRTLTGHRPSEHSTSEYQLAVKGAHETICEFYDQWAIKHAHIYYRIGTDMKFIARLCSTFDPVGDIEEFHTKFELTYPGPTRILPDELQAFRYGFMQEELEEYNEAHDFGDPVKCLDSLVDLVYVALGTSYLHGFNFREAWRRVQHANMQKVRAQRAEDSKRGSTFDVVKPTGWEPPDLKDLIDDHGVDTSEPIVA